VAIQRAIREVATDGELERTLDLVPMTPLLAELSALGVDSGR